MPAVSGWRSPRAAEGYADHDLADFAQEFLSRNPDYQSDYADTERQIAARPDSVDTEMEGLARRWGLSFPLRSPCVNHRKTRILVARQRSHSRRNTRPAR